MSEEKDTPLVPELTPEEAGAQPEKQSSNPITQPEVTANSFPQSPFGQTLTSLAEQGIRGFDNTVGKQLTGAAFRQLEAQIHEVKTELNQKSEKLESEVKRNADLDKKNAVLKHQLTSRNLITTTSSLLLAFGGLSAGHGLSLGDNVASSPILAIGFGTMILGAGLALLGITRKGDLQ